MKKPKTGAVAPWYGSNRIGAAKVGEALAGCSWVGIPFGGGLSEVKHITAKSILVSDSHKMVMNLCAVIASDRKRAALVRMLQRTPFHAERLARSQRFLIDAEVTPVRFDQSQSLILAYHYFIAAWMSRNGEAGTEREFKATFSLRWDGAGGDSAVRFRSATESLDAWAVAMRRCTFLTDDAFAFLKRCRDKKKNGIYADPPFPGAGDRYKVKFTETDQIKLAEVLASFKNATIVCRFYDHPLIRKLYPSDCWEWRTGKGRKQTNEPGAEVLICRRAV